MEIHLDGSELHVAAQNLNEVPSFLMENYGGIVTCLDLSFNEIKLLSNLDGFKKLDSLILDNNVLISEQKLPRMETLQTLSVNSNMIDDLEVFLDSVVSAFPNLNFLSLWKNDCCPNEMIVGKDSEDYKRYRYYVVHRIPKLKYLDSTAVTPEERKEAKRIGSLMKIAKPKPIASSVSSTGAQDPNEASGFGALPAPTEEESGPGASRFGKSRYVYYGKQSEGNRFILNDDL